jgi:precorrin-3B synthase
MTRTHARGACPGLSAPMVTGDGLLVRLMPAGPNPLDAFISLCEAARTHGNSTMEISTRGNLQVRGLTPLSAPLFAGAVAGLNLDISEGVPVLADPLPDDPAALIDANALAAALRRAIAGAWLSLAPKVSVVVDGGGRLNLDALFADIRLRAVATPEGPKLQLALAGDGASGTQLGMIAQDEAVEAVLALLTLIAARGPMARATDVLRAQAGSRAASATAPQRPCSDAIGRHALKDAVFAIGLGLAFGHARAETLAELARVAKTRGADWARPAPHRALLLGPLTQANAMAATRGAEELGFIVDAADPRRRIAACPGAPLCAHGLIAARTLAAEIAREVPLPAGDGIALHVSGCAKGCAHSAPAPLTIVGTERGCGIVEDGTARATPARYLDQGDILIALNRIGQKTKEAVHT